MDSLRKLQLCEFEILKKFKEICEKNDLTYYLSGGTLLGAVRHHGFIPWDDDVDVAMPRPDYEHFVEIAKFSFSDPYFIVNQYTDENYNQIISVIYDKRMKVKVGYTKMMQDKNAWIDIFPLDSMPENKIRFMIRKYMLLYRRFLYMISDYSKLANKNKKSRPIYEKFLMFLVEKSGIEHILNHKKEMQKFDKALRSYSFQEGKYIVNMLGRYRFKSLMEREIYGKKVELDFEGESFRVPEQYDIYLKRIYGDYMSLPPENERNDHKSEIKE